jgi:ubiquinol-cytochrome c reductase cytochrome b subunit
VPVAGQWVARFLLGGDTIGGATLTRVFALHVFIIPGLIIAFVGLHLLLVLRHGIAEPPKAGKPVDPQTYRREYQELLDKTGRPFWPDAAWRDTVFCTAMILVIALLAWHFGAPPLGKPPDPGIIEASPRPDWSLLWYFAVLALLPYNLEKYLMVWGPLIAGMFLIALPFLFNRGERSFRRRPWAVGSLALIAVMIAVLWVLGAQTPWSPNFKAQPLSAAIVGATNGPVFVGGRLFHDKGCLNCHWMAGDGGRRGPDLTVVASRLSPNQIILRIANGGVNMPAYAANLTPAEMDALVAFLETRKVQPP